MMQLKKIEDEQPNDILVNLEKGIRGAFPYLNKKQRVYYKGEMEAGNYEYYFLATHAMAPWFLLENKKLPLIKGDTVLFIYKPGAYTDYFRPDELRSIWQNSDGRLIYLLGEMN